MGCAIARDPQVFLFDEPLSNLDAKLRVQMRTEIKELQQRLRTTSIYVTHDQIEAMTLADRIVVMNDGWVEQIGAPLDVYDEPDTLFVAGFIGSPAMNLVDAELRQSGNRRVAVTGNGTELPAPELGEEGQPVVYGVRPEHLTLMGDSQNGVAMEVVVVEPTGAETLVVGTMADQQFQAVFRERHEFKPGETVHLAPAPGSVHLFDRSTGQRIRS
jgi:multiple sugar transport system ATP-binding protein